MSEEAKKQEHEIFTFLVGDFGKEILKEYEERTELDYKNNKNLKCLLYKDLPEAWRKVLTVQPLGSVTGSNIFSAVLLNNIVNREGLRIARPSDVQRFLRETVHGYHEDYGDTAIVIDKHNKENYLARDLAHQIKRKTKLKYPVMIPLTELELIPEEKNFEYGLALKLKEGANIIHAPILFNEKEGYFSWVNEETGLPSPSDVSLTEIKPYWGAYGVGRIIPRVNKKSGIYRISMKEGKYAWREYLHWHPVIANFRLHDDLVCSNDRDKILLVGDNPLRKDYFKQLMDSYRKFCKDLKNKMETSEFIRSIYCS